MKKITKCREALDGPPLTGFIVLVDNREIDDKDVEHILMHLVHSVKGAFSSREFTDPGPDARKHYAVCDNRDQIELMFLLRGIEKIKKRLEKEGVLIPSANGG